MDFINKINEQKDNAAAFKRTAKEAVILIFYKNNMSEGILRDMLPINMCMVT